MDSKGEVLCRVCGDKASGKHYGVPSCDGCRGFFKRSIRRGLAYHCKESGSCIVDVTRRNQCQACRFKKCLAVNMKRDAVQHERAPRTPLSSVPCPSMVSVRRQSYTFPPHAALISPSPSLVDVTLPSYHFVYSQPPFPFHFKQQMSLPPQLGILTCSTTPYGHRTDPFDITGYPEPPIRLCVDSTEIPQRMSGNTEKKTVDSQLAAEDEVTSTEEPRVSLSEATRETGDSKTIVSTKSLVDLSTPHQITDNVYESAAKLLFLTVKWARSIPSFTQLTFSDQSRLLEESWSDLFVLSAAQWTLPIDEDYLVTRTLAPTSRYETLIKEARRLKEIISRFMLLRVDHTEYACLKALALFKSDTRGLSDNTRVEILQDQTHIMLQDYCRSRDIYKTRFGKLLLLLPSINTLSKDNIEELLFRKTIGNVSVKHILTDMLKTNQQQS